MQSMQGLVKRIIEDKEKYKDLLVFIIKTLDKEFNDEVQTTDNPIGLIRDKIDTILNKYKLSFIIPNRTYLFHIGINSLFLLDYLFLIYQ